MNLKNMEKNQINSIFMNKKNIKYVFFSFLAYIFIKGGYDNCKYEKKLFENKAFTRGLVTDCAFLTRPIDSEIEFEFTVNNQKISSREHKGWFNGICDSVKNKTFPVVYSPKSPHICHILFYNRDFQDYNLSDEEAKKIMRQ